MEKVKQVFDEANEPWGISLPEEDLRRRRSGEIAEQGWVILYQFGEQSGVGFMDCYEMHRLTSDSHHRIWESGEIEPLLTPLDMLVYPGDASEERVQEIQREYREHNRQAARIFKEKWGRQMRCLQKRIAPLRRRQVGEEM
jgi:hypothetical protein